MKASVGFFSLDFCCPWPVSLLRKKKKQSYLLGINVNLHPLLEAAGGCQASSDTAGLVHCVPETLGKIWKEFTTYIFFFILIIIIIVVTGYISQTISRLRIYIENKYLNKYKSKNQKKIHKK